MAANSWLACLEGRSDGCALAEVALVEDDLDVARPWLRREELARPVRRAVVDDDELPAVHWELGRQRVVDGSLDGRELVEHGHEDREAAGHV